MTTLSRLVATWRRWTGWSNTRQAWFERLGLLGLVVLGCVLVFFSDKLEFEEWVAVWSGFVALLLILERFGLVHLFGPVLKYDLIRSSRRSRFYFVRVLYLGLLFVILCGMYWSWAGTQRAFGRPILSSEVSRFAISFFNTFVVVQFCATILLTPAYTAGAIAEEKERRTLEYILATELNNREIILGKLMSRLLHLLLLLIGGLPILSAVQFLGGLDPDLILATFTLTGLTLVSVASASILASVVAKRARDAILLGYLLILVYFVGAYVLMMMVQLTSIGGFPSTNTWTSPITIDSLLRGLLAGHPIHAMRQLTGSRLIGRTLPEIIRDYAMFHGIVFGVCLFLSALLVRRKGLEQNVRSSSVKRKRKDVLPPVGKSPMLWKELSVERGWGRSTFILVVGLTLLAVSLSGVLYDTMYRPHRVPRVMNTWVRFVGTLISCLMLLMIAIRASGSIRGECENHTFESLLTTPLTGNDILSAKWLGSMTSIRSLAICLVVVYGFGVFSDGLSIIAIPLLAFSWFCMASAIATIGLWFSLTSQSSLRAAVATLLTVLGLSFGHWIIWMCLGPMLMFGRLGIFEGLLYFQAGFTPPIALGGFLSFRNRDLSRSSQAEMIFYSILAAIAWAFIGWGVWQKTLALFRKRTSRAYEEHDFEDPSLPRSPETQLDRDSEAIVAVNRNVTSRKR